MPIFARYSAMRDKKAGRLHGDAQPVNHGVSLSAAAAALACKSFHMTEHTYKGPLDGPEALLAQSRSGS